MVWALAAGHIGNLRLEIPWAQLSSKPVTIVIDDLFLLAVPSVEQAYDADQEQVGRRAARAVLLMAWCPPRHSPECVS